MSATEINLSLLIDRLIENTQDGIVRWFTPEGREDDTCRMTMSVAGFSVTLWLKNNAVIIMEYKDGLIYLGSQPTYSITGGEAERLIKAISNLLIKENTAASDKILTGFSKSLGEMK